MSRHTGEISFWFTEGTTSFYFWGKRNGELIEEIHLAYPFRLSAIIHEINECEITNLLANEFVGEMDGKTVINITTKIMNQIVKNFGCIKLRNGLMKSSIFGGVNEIVFISHMISPYATCNCFMPRRKYRVFW